MGAQNHRLVLLRHGETEWSQSGRHTSRTDIALTRAGCDQAEFAGVVLGDLGLDHPYVFSSPRRRALVTAELAGLIVDVVTPVISEWDYGDYEGLTTVQIHQSDPQWQLWTQGCPGGESPAEVSERADRAIALALEVLETRDVVLVSHGHFSRAVITRWLELPIREGARFGMPTATIALCGYEHGIRQLGQLGLSCHPKAGPSR